MHLIKRGPKKRDDQELASRDDPLHEILQTTVYDAVLERSTAL